MLADLLQVESQAETVDAAVNSALERLGCSRAEVELQILQVDARGWLGLFGRRPARIRVRLTDRGFVSRRITEQLLRLSGFAAEVQVQPGSDVISLTIHSDDPSLIIGRHGQTLDALQTLVVTLTDRLVSDRTRLELDIDGYRERRRQFLQRLARRLSTQVKRSGRNATIQPLPPDERRIVHLTLQDESDIEFRSIGQGFERKMLISSRRG